MAAARAAYIAGFASTSNLAARFAYGVPSGGTSAHAFTLVHDSERDAFDGPARRRSARAPPCWWTPSTWSAAVRAAVAAAGPSLGAVRIDSGDLPALAVSVRALLDSLGATATRIILTGDLDEYSIAGLAVAPVDGYGVGTSLVTGSGAPTAALVYKLVARSDEPLADGDPAGPGALRPVAKRSVGKPGRGGRKWAVRERTAAGVAATERIWLAPPEPRPERPPAAAGARPATARSSGGSRSRRRGPGTPTVLAELPSYALQLSRGYPAIPTVFGPDREDA